MCLALQFCETHNKDIVFRWELIMLSHIGWEKKFDVIYVWTSLNLIDVF